MEFFWYHSCPQENYGSWDIYVNIYQSIRKEDSLIKAVTPDPVNVFLICVWFESVRKLITNLRIDPGVSSKLSQDYYYLLIVQFQQQKFIPHQPVLKQVLETSIFFSTILIP